MAQGIPTKLRACFLEYIRQMLAWYGFYSGTASCAVDHYDMRCHREGADEKCIQTFLAPDGTRLLFKALRRLQEGILKKIKEVLSHTCKPNVGS